MVNLTKHLLKKHKCPESFHGGGYMKKFHVHIQLAHALKIHKCPELCSIFTICWDPFRALFNKSWSTWTILKMDIVTTFSTKLQLYALDPSVYIVKKVGRFWLLLSLSLTFFKVGFDIGFEMDPLIFPCQICILDHLLSTWSFPTKPNPFSTWSFPSSLYTFDIWPQLESILLLWKWPFDLVHFLNSCSLFPSISLCFLHLHFPSFTSLPSTFPYNNFRFVSYLNNGKDSVDRGILLSHTYIPKSKNLSARLAAAYFHRETITINNIRLLIYSKIVHYIQIDQ